MSWCPPAAWLLFTAVHQCHFLGIWCDLYMFLLSTGTTEGSGLPVTHAASGNENVLRGELEECLLCPPHKLKYRNRVKDWWILMMMMIMIKTNRVSNCPCYNSKLIALSSKKKTNSNNKTKPWSNAAHWLMMRNISCTQMKWITFLWMLWNQTKKKSVCNPPVKTVPHGGQLESLWGGRWGVEPSGIHNFSMYHVCDAWMLPRFASVDWI